MDSRIDQLLANASEQLTASPDISGDTARLDAELLMCHVIAKPRSYLFTWPDKTLSSKEQEQFLQLIDKRATGIPVAYLTGEKAFWNLNLKVNSDVLIPRPDTELIVELALAQPIPEQALVADLGTGTGAIALAIASERPHWKVLAVDKSTEALNIAKNNARYNKIGNVSFRSGSWCQPLENNKLHMIVTNPPYIREDDHHLVEGDVRFEPLSALASGKDGLDDIRQIIKESAKQLYPKGWILIEHGYDQGEAVATLLTTEGFINVSTERDLAGHDRVTMGQFV